MIRRVFSLLVTLTVLFTVLTATALAVARLWIPAVSNYRAEIESRAAGFLHADVRIGNMEAAWRGLGPIIKFDGITVSDPDDGELLLEVDHIWLAVDMWSLISKQEVLPAGVSVIGTSLDFVEDENGNLRLKNFSSTTPPEEVARWLLGQPRITLLQSTINLYRGAEDDDPAHFSDVNLSLRKSNSGHRASGYVRLPEQLGKRLDVQADLRGSVDDVPWSGRVYVQARSLSLGEVSRQIGMYADIPFLFSGTMDARLWFDIADTRLQSIIAELDVSGIRVRDADVSGSIAFDAERLGGLVAWRQKDSVRQLSIERLYIERNGQALREMDLSLAVRQDEDGSESVTCIADHVNLQDASRLLLSMPMTSEGLREQLAALQPEGELDGVHASFSKQGDRITGLSFQGKFHDFGNQAWKGIPGFSGLDGVMRGTSDQGAVEIYSRNVLIDGPGFFSEALHFDRIKGIVQWQRFADKLRIGAAEISLRADGLEARSRLILDMPDGAEEPYLDMQVRVDHARVGRVSHYLPTLVMPERGVAWLNQALVSGRVNAGILFHGNPSAFPFG